MHQALSLETSSDKSRKYCAVQRRSMYQALSLETSSDKKGNYCAVQRCCIQETKSTKHKPNDLSLEQRKKMGAQLCNRRVAENNGKTSCYAYDKIYSLSIGRGKGLKCEVR